jgi:hypothetical protein
MVPSYRRAKSKMKMMKKKKKTRTYSVHYGRWSFGDRSLEKRGGHSPVDTEEVKPNEEAKSE